LSEVPRFVHPSVIIYSVEPVRKHDSCLRRNFDFSNLFWFKTELIENRLFRTSQGMNILVKKPHTPHIKKTKRICIVRVQTVHLLFYMWYDSGLDSVIHMWISNIFRCVKEWLGCIQGPEGRDTGLPPFWNSL